MRKGERLPEKREVETKERQVQAKAVQLGFLRAEEDWEDLASS
jgi:hypothetical protein